LTAKAVIERIINFSLITKDL